ncbi:tRNA (guanine(46)-N(7))-methyltransferase TrmB [Agarivorans sp. MS3-6]|uniref:tRNA (guanine(46)-N(7))-methyltransferase TrmB n=1 Tax=Agarivorans sp. TSD2052 TaxID=2937286 RepID=UPI0020103FBE|nr:methyltransferase domain-containing protein [Agarivorans sp. TSD2052]UPW20675.1 methyltransferase domain-containing protein [Agarivorans sp. TSD2052]
MMEGNSRSVSSNQQGVHEKLEKVVLRHLNEPFQKPYQQHTLDAFRQLEKQVSVLGRPIVLDSCCGTGLSTAALALLHPEAVVIGLDKSAHRLTKHHAHFDQEGQNYQLLQVDLNDFWRLACDAGWQPSHHYVLYPNPWPKSRHLQRRWHGSAVFPYMIKLGGQLELRSNWSTYLEEFQIALRLAGHTSQLNQYHSDNPITAFERKYLNSGQQLWQLRSYLRQFVG